MTTLWKTRLEEGGAAVEMAIVLPCLIIIFFGAIDFGRLFYAYIAVSSAAHEAALFAARSPGAEVTPGALSTVVAAESYGFLKPMPAGSTPGPNGNTVISSPTVVADATKVPMAQVQVTYSFQPVAAIPLRGPISVSATSAAPLPGDVLP